LPGMNNDVFRLKSQIIEITEKPKVPVGYMGKNPSGETVDFDEDDYGENSYRALLDIGVLDISDHDFLIPEDTGIEFIGGSSDMLVLDLKDNKQNFQVCDFLTFKLKYMCGLRLLNSDYIEKRVVS